MSSPGWDAPRPAPPDPTNNAPPGPFEANLFFLAVMTLLVLLGAQVQRTYGTLGIALTEILFFLAIPLFLILLVDRRPPAEVLSLRPISRGTAVRSAVAALLVWPPAMFSGAAWIWLLQQVGDVPQFAPFTLETRSQVLTALAVGAVLPAICEEAAFRGYIQRGYSRLAPHWAVLGPGLLFAFMHLSVIRLPPLVLLGLLFSWVVWRTGSIWPAVIMHLVNNTTAIVAAAYLPTLVRQSGALTGSETFLPAITAAELTAMLPLALLSAFLLRFVLRGFPAHRTAPPHAARAPLWAWLPLAGTALIFVLAASYELGVITGRITP